MNRVLIRWAAVFSASALAASSPAFADFSIPSAKPKVTKPSGQRPARRPSRPRPVEPEAPPAPIITGIDPALMQEAVTEARYSATLVRDAAAHTAVLQVTDGKTGWSVNFSDCAQENQCKSMEFYTLWRVSNEANVCSVWGTDVTKDPSRTLGRPFCYTVPSHSKQLHLKLSSDQAPYVGMNQLAIPAAKERMNGMIGTWATYLGQLNEAWKIASARCPRVSDKCT